MNFENFDLALEYALKAIEVDPRNHEGYLCAIDCLLTTGELNKAEEILKKFERNVRKPTEFDGILKF